MPKGKRYTDAEVHLIAKAYCWATNDGIKGSEQKLDSFMQRVVEYLKRHAPDNVIEGTYHTRDVKDSSLASTSSVKAPRLSSTIMLCIITQVSTTFEMSSMYQLRRGFFK